MLGNRTDLTGSRVSLYANKALEFIWNAVEHDKSEALAVSSTTSGENRITLPTDIQELTAISNTSAVPPQLLLPWNVNDIDSSYTYSGTPQNYVLFSDYLELWPTPNSAFSLQLRYKTRVPTVSLTTAVSSLHTRYDMAHLYKTVEFCADAVKDWESAAVFRSKFLSEIASVPSDLAMRQRAKEGMRVSLPHAPRTGGRLDSLVSII
jgi:hypothetical protein